MQHPVTWVPAGAAVSAGAIALTFLCYGPSLRAEFVSDDINAIVENEWVHGPLDTTGIATHFSWWGQARADSPGYRPAATLTFALSHLASGMDPFGFRIVNFVMHALCTLLLVALATTLGLHPRAAGAAGLLFAVLPIHSEAVIWIVGRAELGAAAGFLAAAWMILVHRRSGSMAALAAAAVSVSIGMAFKENAVTVLAWPLILFLVMPRAETSDNIDGNAPAQTHAEGAATRDSEAGHQSSRAARREAARARQRKRSTATSAVPASTPMPIANRDTAALVALIAGVVAYALLRMAANGPPITPEPGSLIDNPLSVVDPFTRILGAVAVFGRYIALTVWPASLSVDYSYDALGIGQGFRANADTLVAMTFVAAASWAALRGPGRRSVTRAGLLMAAASYSIVSNTVFVLGTILGERLFYLPSAGLCLAFAAIAEPAFTAPSRRRYAIAGLALLILAAVAVDRHRAAQWATPVSLFHAAVEVVPRSARAQMELGTAYGNAGRVDEALDHFVVSLAILPDFAAAAYNQGNALVKARRFDEASAAFRQAATSDPKLLRAWHNLALSEQNRGDRRAWIAALKDEAKAFPNSAPIGNEVGETLIRAGAYTEAIAVYDGLVVRGAATVPSYFNRGVARHHLGGCIDAIDDYRQAVSMPDAPRDVFVAATDCLKELGLNEAAATLTKAAPKASQVANRDTRR